LDRGGIRAIDLKGSVQMAAEYVAENRSDFEICLRAKGTKNGI
jgi:hypothetical protein